MTNVEQDLQHLTQNLKTTPDKLALLRTTIELSLLKLGHAQDDIDEALEKFFKQQVH